MFNFVPASRAGLLLAASLTFASAGGVVAQTDPEPPPAGTPSTTDGTTRPAHVPDPAFLALEREIIMGKATLAQVRHALTNPDIGALTNTVHALYSMRWHRGVYNLLHDMWDDKEDKYPELQWPQFRKAPVRLALASTLLRIEPASSEGYVAYLREHENDEHEFHRAQVLIGLAFNADPRDVDYLTSMASGDNHFVVQTAITALGLMSLPPAKKALETLYEKFRDDPRSKLIRDVLLQSYNQGSERDERLWRELQGGAPHSSSGDAPAGTGTDR